MAVSGVTKPASSMRSTAMILPSGPTTAIETGTPMACAFSTASLMNSRHSAASNFAIAATASRRQPFLNRSKPAIN